MMRGTAILCLIATACGRWRFDEIELEDAESSPADVSQGDQPCPAASPTDTVALYTFDAGLGDDATGQHTGTVRDTVAQTPGNCGSAARFTPNGYILVADSAELDLATGSLELFVRLATAVPSDNEVLVSRDASGTAMDGHLSLIVTPGDELIFRLQAGGESYHRCAAGLPRGTWVHIGASFGGAASQGMRLWMNHVEAVAPTATLQSGPVDCTGATFAGLAGNDNALVLGGSNARVNAEGAPDPSITQFIDGGELDHVHLRSVWRDFSAD